MGIPTYYKNIINNYPEIITSTENINETIDYLFLDLNCAIHPCCANKTDENEMYISVFEKIKECISITNVKKLVYIAIDGPAPRTKMEQQRQRRLKSAQEKKIWDTNQITPGTEFMNNLSIFLHGKCELLNVKWIISDSNERGEGEHKIMHYIDTIKEDKTCVVYGLDADLIMLSMLRNKKIYLLREKTSYNIECIETELPYIYLNVNLLKKSLIKTIKKDFYQLPDYLILYDYLFICFLIGNDFIINTPSVNIRYGGLDHLLDTYILLQNDRNGFFNIIDDKKNLNINNFKLFLEKLSFFENQKLKNIQNIRNNQQNKYKKMYYNILKQYKPRCIEDINEKKINIDKEQLDEIKNHSPILFRENEDIIFKNDKNYYMFNFYNTLNYNPSYEMLLKNDKKKLCNEYLKSIIWTYQYYFHKCINWKWYYEYHFSPYLSDLIDYMKEINTINIIEKNDISYTPQEQLKIVLPLQNDSHLYPKQTPLYSLMKRYYWECHPIMIHKY